VNKLGYVCVVVVVMAVRFQVVQAQLKPHSNAEADAAIRAVLKAQVDAWNRHDLERFMAGYWRSPDLTFFSGGTEISGWDDTLQRYRSRYQAGGNEMGTLSFEGLRVVVLGPDAAFVRGQYHLATADGKNPHGLFTLVFRKSPEGWLIVHDHSSSGL